MVVSFLFCNSQQQQQQQGKLQFQVAGEMVSRIWNDDVLSVSYDNARKSSERAVQDALSSRMESH